MEKKNPIHFSELCKTKLRFLELISFAKERGFLLLGAADKQKRMTWGSQHQETVFEASLDSSMLRVRRAVSGTKIEGTLSYDGTATRVRYTKLLRYNLLLEPAKNHSDMIFRQTELLRTTLSQSATFWPQISEYVDRERRQIRWPVWSFDTSSAISFSVITNAGGNCTRSPRVFLTWMLALR